MKLTVNVEAGGVSDVITQVENVVFVGGRARNVLD